MNQAKFGKHPSGKAMQRIKASGHYRKGSFQNLNPTPSLTGDASYFSIMRDFFFKKIPNRKPHQTLPSLKTDLLHLSPGKNILVWFGHSSYFIQVNGMKILVDPVFSGAASPLAFTTRSFPGSDVYTSADMPEIDCLFLTHDHWDHLDYQTLLRLKPKIRKIVTSLGVSAHLSHWGFDTNRITELNWEEEVVLRPGFIARAAPARHFSGRGFRRGQSHWSSFVFQTPGFNLFLGGDSGYDSHFKEIGARFGPFDLAILECGQYNPSWKYIHTSPEETVQAALDLKAKSLLPVHWGKFALALHDWNDPPIRVRDAAMKTELNLITPLIGQEVNLDIIQAFDPWWEKMKA
ncbi:MAG TPA: MBL fold metallo-hydrolase [Bacteroidia bacterium]|nr:MBL fold metallo-hydrolase [Bacteroidia bacterium]